MKKPFHQLIAENAVGILFSIGSLASVINGIANATSFVNFKWGLLLIALVSLSWIILFYLVKTGKMKWGTGRDRSFLDKKLGMKINLFFTGILLILGIQTGYDFYKSNDSRNKATIAKIVFKKNESAFKLLILPWKKECYYEGSKYDDIGLVIKRRLENMILKDSVNLQVYYLDDSTMTKNFNRDSARMLMQYHHADQILYGYYSLSQCESDHSDKVCFMYQTDLKKWGIEIRDKGEEYKMLDMHGLDNIREGAGQENIDHIIYRVAAMSEMSNKNFRRAIRLLEHIKDYEKNETVLFQLSNCYYYLGDFARTRSLLEKVLEVNPLHAEAIAHVSAQLMKEGKSAKAKELLARIPVDSPKDINVLRDLSLSYRALHDTAMSDFYYKKFMETVPATDNKTLGIFHKELGKYAEAKIYYEKALKHCDKHAGDWDAPGEVYLRLGDTVKAKKYFSKALALSENSFLSQYNIGLLLHKEKKYKEAEPYLEKAAQLHPFYEKAWVSLGNTYVALEKNKEALACFERVLSTSPYDAGALIGAAVAHMKSKQHETANKYLDQLMSHYHDDPQLLSTIGYLCADKENYAQAEVYYRRLLKLAPANGAILYNLASMSAYQHEQTEALRYLSQALTTMPSLKETANKDKAFDWLRSNEEFVAITR